MRLGQRLLGPVGADADHQVPGAHDPDGHVAVQQEPEPAEHRLLGDPVDAGELFADPVGEVLIDGHHGPR